MPLDLEILGHFLPDSILSAIFSQYLSLKEVSHFDVAICSKSRRPLFMECIQSEACIWLGNKKQDLSRNSDYHYSYSLKYSFTGNIHPKMSWLHSRSVKTRHLMCNRVTYDVAVKVSELGSSLHWLSIKDKQVYLHTYIYTHIHIHVCINICI
jgi:hypothetical protein